MIKKASADRFQVQDFVKKKSKLKPHNNKTHKNDESIQTAEHRRASPLLFEDRAAPTDEGYKKKKKKKNKEQPQSLLDNSVPVELEHEISNETEETASQKRKKKKRKRSSSTGEQSDVTSVAVNQHNAGVCGEVHADYVYIQQPVKKKRKKKLPAEVELCELPASERQDETDDKRLIKKKKKKRSGSTQEYREVTVDQSLLSSPEQNRRRVDIGFPLPKKKKKRSTQVNQEYRDVTVDQSLLSSPEQNRRGVDIGFPLPKKKKKRIRSTEDKQEYTDVTVDQSLLSSPEQKRRGVDIGFPLPTKKKKRIRSTEDKQEYTDVTVDQSVLSSPERNGQGEDTGLVLPKKKKKRISSTQDKQEYTDVTVDQSVLSSPERNGQGEDTGLVLPKKKKKRIRSTQDKQEYTDVTVDQSVLSSPEQNGQGEDTGLVLPKKKKKRIRSTQDKQEYTGITVDQSVLSSPERNGQGEDTGLVLPKKKKKKRIRSTEDKQEYTDVTVDQSVLSSPEQNGQGEDTGLLLPKEERDEEAPQQCHEDGGCGASVVSEDSTHVPAQFLKSTKVADGSPKKYAVCDRKVTKSSAFVTEDSSSESDVMTPEPSASKRKKNQNSSITKTAASHKLGMDDEGYPMCLPVDLDALKQELEEFIPHVRNISENSIRKMSERDLARFKQFKKQGIAVKFGRFSQKENDQIRKNIENFLSITGIDSAEKLLFTSRYPEDKETIHRLKVEHLFCQKLSEGIPRPWRLIYYRARKMFDPNNYKGRYTSEEKEKLKKYHTIYGNDWMKISEMMSRSNLSVAMKYSEIKSAINYGAWSKEETRKLMHAVEEVIRKRVETEDADSLSSSEKSNRDILIDFEKLYQKLPWTEIEAKVGTRYWRQCKQKWTTVLTSKMTKGEPLYRGTKGLLARINLIKRLHEMKVEDANDINWDELSNIIGNVPKSYVRARFYKLKVSSVPLWKKKTFSEIIDYLFEKKLPELEEKLEKKRRKQLTSDNWTNTEQKKTFRLSEIFDSSEETD